MSGDPKRERTTNSHRVMPGPSKRCPTRKYVSRKRSLVGGVWGGGGGGGGGGGVVLGGVVGDSHKGKRGKGKCCYPKVVRKQSRVYSLPRE